jgi:hypothetical protein
MEEYKGTCKVCSAENADLNEEGKCGNCASHDKGEHKDKE